MRPLGCCAPWSTTPSELIATTRCLSSADGLRGPLRSRTPLGVPGPLRDQRPHLPAMPGKADPYAGRTASLGSTVGLPVSGRRRSSAAQRLTAVDRRQPLRTAIWGTSRARLRGRTACGPRAASPDVQGEAGPRRPPASLASRRRRRGSPRDLFRVRENEGGQTTCGAGRIGAMSCDDG